MHMEGWVVRALDAARYAVVHEFPGGAQALAKLTGMNRGTLCNKVNPAVDTHRLSVDEAVLIGRATGDHRVLFAQAMAQGYACVQVGDHTGVSDVELLTAYADWHAQTSRTAAAIGAALAAKRITRNRLDEIRREMCADFRAELELLYRLGGLCVDQDH